MKVVSNPSNQNIKSAARALIEGQLVVFPTETVYGLGGNAENVQAIEKIYIAKGRPINHPIIVHISSSTHLSDWAINIPEYAFTLAEKFWPGPMTLILQRSEKAKDFITGGQKTVGVRVPNHIVALDLLREFNEIGGRGIAAPSANLFGKVSPTTTEAVTDAIGPKLSDQDWILDGGNCKIGIESTIISCLSVKPYILRPGAVTEEMIKAIVQLEINTETEVKHSGSGDNHYAPNAQVFLDEIPNIGDGFFALSEIPTPLGAVRLASPKNLNDFAFELYEAFRLADKKGIDKIFVMSPPRIGLGIAIYDRLAKSRYKN